MSILLYNLFLWFYRALLHISSPFHLKARRWVRGRRKVLERIHQSVEGKGPIVWMHCASLGEFEQGRPLLEAIKKSYPGYKVLLTFFSPSGYEAQKNYQFADWVFYMPLDGPVTAKRFLESVRPSLVIFVKYEFWFYYLKKIKYRNIPLILVSALFRENMTFFKWYGKLQRKMLSRFDQLFVQNEISSHLMSGIGLQNITTISGDTRFDRVAEIAEGFQPIPEVASFVGNYPVLVAGSTWQQDEQLLSNALEYLDPQIKLVIAPHELNEKNLEVVKKLFPNSVSISELMRGSKMETRVLIIDNMGMLSRLYKYATVTYVGGGWSKSGIHNILEPAVYGKPVLFGSNYSKYSEAVGLVAAGGGLPLLEKNPITLAELVNGLVINNADYLFMSEQAREFVSKNRGATNRIMSYIQEKRLLTS